MAFEERRFSFDHSETEIHGQYANEHIRLTAPTPGAVRVQATRNSVFADRAWALEVAHHGDVPKHGAAIYEYEADGITGIAMESGELRAVVSIEGVLRFENSRTGVVLIEEPAPRRPFEPSGRSFRPISSELWQVEQRFRPREERIYGMGQHQDGVFDRKGSEVELFQRNTEVAIPVYYSTAGYGFLWNNPAIGQVGFATNGTRWRAEATREIDYCVFLAPTPAEGLSRYSELTGTSPEMPEYAAGFWQSKLRYENQEEALTVLREYRRRELPLSVLVIDFFHWPHMGDWRFDQRHWPDPTAMAQEAQEGGTELMVSVWPTVNPDSDNYSEMHRRGLLAQSEYGTGALMEFTDADTEGTKTLYYYDPFNPEAREFIWSQAKRNYYDHGVRIFWLDACEPEAYPYDPGNVRYFAGRGDEVGCAYPLMHQRAFYEGMREAGHAAPLNLCRSAWAGSQRYGAAVWSGDIEASFEALRTQVPAGLSMAMSGIPWWTTDIGGFFANPTDTARFRELLIRWFQYGVFCPIFRLHGFRDSSDFKRGGPNELWSFGEEVYAIVRQLLKMREVLKPYLLEQMRKTARQGIPVMRPLFVDFPEDENTYSIWDQFMFGPDIIAAPVLEEGTTSRTLYVPNEGSKAVSSFSLLGNEQVVTPGGWIEVEAPLAKIPILVRSDSEIAKLLQPFAG